VPPESCLGQYLNDPPTVEARITHQIGYDAAPSPEMVSYVEELESVISPQQAATDAGWSTMAIYLSYASEKGHGS